MKKYDEVIKWIKLNPFTKPGPCDCDFEGNWLGNGVCVGCNHPVTYFKEGWCTYPISYKMSAQEIKDTILDYLNSF